MTQCMIWLSQGLHVITNQNDVKVLCQNDDLFHHLDRQNCWIVGSLRWQKAQFYKQLGSTQGQWKVISLSLDDVSLGHDLVMERPVKHLQQCFAWMSAHIAWRDMFWTKVDTLSSIETCARRLWDLWYLSIYNLYQSSFQDPCQGVLMQPTVMLCHRISFKQNAKRILPLQRYWLPCSVSMSGKLRNLQNLWKNWSLWSSYQSLSSILEDQLADCWLSFSFVIREFSRSNHCQGIWPSKFKDLFWYWLWFHERAAWLSEIHFQANSWF